MATSGPLPAHPGRVIRGGCRAAVLSLRAAAATLNLAEGDLADVLDGSADITPDLALKLETAGWSNAPFWLRLQDAYDRAWGACAMSVRRRNRPEPVRKVRPLMVVFGLLRTRLGDSTGPLDTIS